MSDTCFNLQGDGRTPPVVVELHGILREFSNVLSTPCTDSGSCSVYIYPFRSKVGRALRINPIRAKQLVGAILDECLAAGLMRAFEVSFGNPAGGRPEKVGEVYELPPTTRS